MYKLKLFFASPQNKIWIIPTVGMCLSLFFIYLISYIDNNTNLPKLLNVNTQTLDSILSIIASSMLSVATFSLGIMVSAFSSASGGLTPRATYLVMNDLSTQKAISTFLGAFLFSVVAKIALGQGIFSSSGVSLLFVFTIALLFYIVIILINWVRRLSTLGRQTDTSNRIFDVTSHEVKAFFAHQNLNTNHTPRTHKKYCFKFNSLGYINAINLTGLNAYCQSNELKIDLEVYHGYFIDCTTPIGYATKELNVEDILKYFIISDARVYEKDPSFGLLVFSEIAQRALSPAINDPQTACYMLTAYCQSF